MKYKKIVPPFGQELQAPTPESEGEKGVNEEQTQSKPQVSFFVPSWKVTQEWELDHPQSLSFSLPSPKCGKKGKIKKLLVWKLIRAKTNGFDSC